MALDPTAEQFRMLALRMKAADASLMPLARKNIRLATAPAGPAVRASALAILPKSGGLNEWVAEAKVKTSILTGAKTAGVRIRVTKKGHDMRDIDAGKVRHRVYGKWQKGVPTQQVQPGFASKPLAAMAPEVGVACMAALREAAAIAGFK